MRRLAILLAVSFCLASPDAYAVEWKKLGAKATFPVRHPIKAVKHGAKWTWEHREEVKFVVTTAAELAVMYMAARGGR